MSAELLAFTKARAMSASMAERNDCAVIALACALGMEYTAAAMLCASLGRRHRKGTPWDTIHAFLGQYIAGYHKSESWTILPRPVAASVWATLHAKPAARYLVYTRGHMFAVCNRVVLDPAARRSPTRSMRRVRRYLEIPNHAC
jgi:hypothetical protein